MDHSSSETFEIGFKKKECGIQYQTEVYVDFMINLPFMLSSVVIIKKLSFSGCFQLWIWFHKGFAVNRFAKMLSGTHLTC